jgi:hypothetical protein
LNTGTVRSGAFDGYFGDDGRDPSFPAYNETAVVQSMVGSSIVAASSSVYINPTREHHISFIRSSALITCLSNNSFGIPPCSGQEMCLYDIEMDPCESNNLARAQRAVALHLRSLLLEYRNTLVKQTNLPPDTQGADPRRWNGTWSPWVLDGCGLDASQDLYSNVCDRNQGK